MEASEENANIDINGLDQPKIIQWEELQHELARLWSLSSALKEAHEKKGSLVQKLESCIQVKRESLERSNELEEMSEKLEKKKLAIENTVMCSKTTQEDLETQRVELCGRIRSLLVASKTLSTAGNQLQEADRLLGVERGYVHLKNLQMLRMRQQYMIKQVSALYPVKVSLGQANEEKMVSQLKATNSGNDTGLQSLNVPKVSNSGLSSLTISGLQPAVPPLRKISFFSDKKEVQRSATALGYVAHAVSLIASYLDVPLRYPLRLGGSHSYIFDSAPSMELPSSDLNSNSMVGMSVKPTEFPLFLDGQDATRAAYAIFLLNKDLEQLLNFIGAESLGPRHVLANLKELYRTVQSHEYLSK